MVVDAATQHANVGLSGVWAGWFAPMPRVYPVPGPARAAEAVPMSSEAIVTMCEIFMDVGS